MNSDPAKSDAHSSEVTQQEQQPLLPFHHVSVLGPEVINGLAIASGGHYLDVTVGGGGHSQLILEAAPDTQITALDRDQQALAAAATRLQAYGDRVHLIQQNFAEYNPGEQKFTGIIADLGVNSHQLDQPERGFSFRQEAPLDMRMDQQQVLTAADLVNQSTEAELADIFYYYGEERYSRRIARRIVEQRPFTTTTQLASVIARAQPSRPSTRRGGIHPATRVFQALRIVVNQELAALETFLQQAPGWLEPGGRIGVISFHSLEDRLVKYAFRNAPELRILTKKPLIAQALEVENNPRSRSAKLRLAERMF